MFLPLYNYGTTFLRGGTPFGPVELHLPESVNQDIMLQMAVSDFLPNSLMYHGHNVKFGVWGFFFFVFSKIFFFYHQKMIIKLIFLLRPAYLMRRLIAKLQILAQL